MVGAVQRIRTHARALWVITVPCGTGTAILIRIEVEWTKGTGGTVPLIVTGTLATRCNVPSDVSRVSRTVCGHCTFQRTAWVVLVENAAGTTILCRIVTCWAHRTVADIGPLIPAVALTTALVAVN